MVVHNLYTSCVILVVRYFTCLKKSTSLTGNSTGGSGEGGADEHSGLGTTIVTIAYF